jgi:hydroxyacylglutathione hydrolase
VTTLQIEQFPCRSDNFGVLIHDTATGATASIDAPEENPILDVLEQRGWQLTHILVTHHHLDHVEANLALKNKFSATIIGPRDEADKIPGLDTAVGGGDKFKFEEFDVEVIATPGHTLGHISYYFPGAETVFTADTLFALGCGRIFEGTPAQMYQSLQKLAALPDNTVVYCGHEYTEANARFALTINPGNQQLVQRATDIHGLRATGKPTLPTTIGLEKVTNPFLRADDPDIRKLLDMESATDEEVFAEIRRRKDNF